MENPKISDNVIRTVGDYVVGRTGKVIEINKDAKRVKVAWNGYNKTWVSYGVVELEK